MENSVNEKVAYGTDGEVNESRTNLEPSAFNVFTF